MRYLGLPDFLRLRVFSDLSVLLKDTAKKLRPLTHDLDTVSQIQSSLPCNNKVRRDRKLGVNLGAARLIQSFLIV